MNRRNKYEKLLQLANDDLAKTNGRKIVLEKEEDGLYFSVIIQYPDGKTHCFAEGNFESELGNIINDAWAHAKAGPKHGLRTMKPATVSSDMHCTDVSELCTAIKNIEKRDLSRVVNKLGGKYTFPKENTPYLELYTEGDGPCSMEITSVRCSGSNVFLFVPDLEGELDSTAAYPGHLSAITEKILENIAS